MQLPRFSSFSCTHRGALEALLRCQLHFPRSEVASHCTALWSVERGRTGVNARLFIDQIRARIHSTFFYRHFAQLRPVPCLPFFAWTAACHLLALASLKECICYLYHLHHRLYNPLNTTSTARTHPIETASSPRNGGSYCHPPSRVLLASPARCQPDSRNTAGWERSLALSDGHVASSYGVAHLYASRSVFLLASRTELQLHQSDDHHLVLCRLCQWEFTARSIAHHAFQCVEQQRRWRECDHVGCCASA